MPANEYALQGVRFTPAIDWVNDSSADFDAAQAIGGSLPIGIPGSQNNDIVLELTTPVRAFGFWVIQNNGSPQPTVFTAIDGSGLTIESVTFGSIFRDGIIGSASYGFMGIEANRDVARIRVTKGFAMLDNFYTAQVPEPNSAALVALTTAVAFAQKRMGRRK